MDLSTRWACKARQISRSTGLASSPLRRHVSRQAAKQLQRQLWPENLQPTSYYIQTPGLTASAIDQDGNEVELRLADHKQDDKADLVGDLATGTVLRGLSTHVVDRDLLLEQCTCRSREGVPLE